MEKEEDEAVVSPFPPRSEQSPEDDMLDDDDTSINSEQDDEFRMEVKDDPVVPRSRSLEDSTASHESAPYIGDVLHVPTEDPSSDAMTSSWIFPTAAAMSSPRHDISFVPPGSEEIQATFADPLDGSFRGERKLPRANLVSPRQEISFVPSESNSGDHVHKKEHIPRDGSFRGVRKSLMRPSSLDEDIPFVPYTEAGEGPSTVIIPQDGSFRGERKSLMRSSSPDEDISFVPNIGTVEKISIAIVPHDGSFRGERKLHKSTSSEEDISFVPSMEDINPNEAAKSSPSIPMDGTFRVDTAGRRPSGDTVSSAWDIDFSPAGSNMETAAPPCRGSYIMDISSPTQGDKRQEINVTPDRIGKTMLTSPPPLKGTFSGDVRDAASEDSLKGKAGEREINFVPGGSNMETGPPPGQGSFVEGRVDPVSTMTEINVLPYTTGKEMPTSPPPQQGTFLGKTKRSTDTAGLLLSPPLKQEKRSGNLKQGIENEVEGKDATPTSLVSKNKSREIDFSPGASEMATGPPPQQGSYLEADRRIASNTEGKPDAMKDIVENDARPDSSASEAGTSMAQHGEAGPPSRQGSKTDRAQNTSAHRLDIMRDIVGLDMGPGPLALEGSFIGQPGTTNLLLVQENYISDVSLEESENMDSDDEAAGEGEDIIDDNPIQDDQDFWKARKLWDLAKLRKKNLEHEMETSNHSQEGGQEISSGDPCEISADEDGKTQLADSIHRIGALLGSQHQGQEEELRPVDSQDETDGLAQSMMKVGESLSSSHSIALLKKEEIGKKIDDSGRENGKSLDGTDVALDGDDCPAEAKEVWGDSHSDIVPEAGATITPAPTDMTEDEIVVAPNESIAAEAKEVGDDGYSDTEPEVGTTTSPAPTDKTEDRIDVAPNEPITTDTKEGWDDGRCYTVPETISPAQTGNTEDTIDLAPNEPFATEVKGGGDDSHSDTAPEAVATISSASIDKAEDEIDLATNESIAREAQYVGCDGHSDTPVGVVATIFSVLTDKTQDEIDSTPNGSIATEAKQAGNDSHSDNAAGAITTISPVPTDMAEDENDFVPNESIARMEAMLDETLNSQLGEEEVQKDTSRGTVLDSDQDDSDVDIDALLDDVLESPIDDKSRESSETAKEAESSFADVPYAPDNSIARIEALLDEALDTPLEESTSETAAAASVLHGDDENSGIGGMLTKNSDHDEIEITFEPTSEELRASHVAMKASPNHKSSNTDLETPPARNRLMRLTEAARSSLRARKPSSPPTEEKTKLTPLSPPTISRESQQNLTKLTKAASAKKKSKMKTKDPGSHEDEDEFWRNSRQPAVPRFAGAKNGGTETREDCNKIPPKKPPVPRFRSTKKPDSGHFMVSATAARKKTKNKFLSKLTSWTKRSTEGRDDVPTAAEIFGNERPPDAENSPPFKRSFIDRLSKPKPDFKLDLLHHDENEVIGTPSILKHPRHYAISPMSLQSNASLTSLCTVDHFCSPRRAGIRGCQKKFNPYLHSYRGPCELCVFFLTDKEKASLDEQGRHIRVMFTTGGCCHSCEVFPRTHGEPPARLCRACFYNSHRTMQEQRPQTKHTHQKRYFPALRRSTLGNQRDETRHSNKVSIGS